MTKRWDDERSAPSDVEEYRKQIRSGRPGAYSYVKLLGLETGDPLKLVVRVQQGLPFHVFERFQRSTALSTKIWRRSFRSRCGH